MSCCSTDSCQNHSRSFKFKLEWGFTHGKCCCTYHLIATGMLVVSAFKHCMQLVELFDNLFDLLKMIRVQKFHLDGQTIVLDDYLKFALKTATRCNVIYRRGKLKIGLSISCRMTTWSPVKPTSAIPWLDRLNAHKWGKSTPDWLLPDTFGNMGNTSNSSKIRIHVATFGRGVKPIDWPSLEDEQFTSQFSEMYWQGADGSRVLGILLPTGTVMGMKFSG